MASRLNGAIVELLEITETYGPVVVVASDPIVLANMNTPTHTFCVTTHVWAPDIVNLGWKGGNNPLKKISVDVDSAVGVGSDDHLYYQKK